MKGGKGLYLKEINSFSLIIRKVGVTASVILRFIGRAKGQQRQSVEVNIRVRIWKKEAI